MTRVSLPTAAGRSIVQLAVVFWVCTHALVARSAEPHASPEARSHFNAGVTHLNAGRYEPAYTEFKAAYAATPSWKILGNLGIAADDLERDGEAIDALEGYLAHQGDLGDRETKRVQKHLERVRARIATVKIDFGPGAFWITDTRADETPAVVNQYGPFDGHAELRIRGGRHDFKLERAGGSGSAWSVTVAPGDVASHAVETPTASVLFTAPEPESQPTANVTPAVVDRRATSHLAPYVLWGSGAAAVVVSTVLFLESEHLQHQANAAFARNCPNGVVDTDPDCTPTTPGDARATNWRTASLVTGIGGIGALVGGTVLYFLDARSSHGDDAASSTSLRPWLTTAEVGVTGSF